MLKLVVSVLLLAVVFAEEREFLSTTTALPESGSERSAVIENGGSDDRYAPQAPGGPNQYPWITMVRRVERIEDLLERMYETVRFQCGLGPQQPGVGGNGPHPNNPNLPFPENNPQYNPQYQPYGAWGQPYGKRSPIRAKRSEMTNAETPTVNEEAKPDLHIVEEPKEVFTSMMPEIEHESSTTLEFTTQLPLDHTTFGESTSTFHAEEFTPELHADEELTTILPTEHPIEEFSTTLPAEGFNAVEAVSTTEEFTSALPELELTTLAKAFEEPRTIEPKEGKEKIDSSSEEEEEEKEEEKHDRKRRQAISSESEEVTFAPTAETTLAPIAPEAIEHTMAAAENLVEISTTELPIREEMNKEFLGTTEEFPFKEESFEFSTSTTELPIRDEMNKEFIGTTEEFPFKEESFEFSTSTTELPIRDEMNKEFVGTTEEFPFKEESFEFSTSTTELPLRDEANKEFLGTTEEFPFKEESFEFSTTELPMRDEMNKEFLGTTEEFPFKEESFEFSTSTTELPIRDEMNKEFLGTTEEFPFKEESFEFSTSTLAAIHSETILPEVTELPIETTSEVMPLADESTWTTEHPLADELTSEHPLADEFTTELPISTEWTSEHPLADEFTTEHPLADELTSEHPIADESSWTTELPISTEWTSEHPIADESSWTTELPTSTEFIIAMEKPAEELQHAEPAAAPTPNRWKRDEEAMVEDKTHIDIETTTVLLSTPFETSPLPEAAEVATEIAAETSTLAETSTFAETTVPIVTDALLATTEAGLVETAPIVPAVETPSTNDVAVAAPTPDESTHLPEVMLEETTFASTIEPEVTTIVDVMHRKKRSEEAMLTQEKAIADPAPTPFIEEEHKPTPAIEVHPTEKMEIIEDKPALPIEVQPTEMIETIEEGKSAPAIEVHPTEMIETMEDKSTPAIEIHPTEKMEIIEDKPALPIEVHPTEKMETMEEELLTTTLIPEHTEIADLPADDEPSKEEEPKSVEIEEHEIEKEKPAPAIEVDPKEPEEPETFELDAAMKAEAANPARRRFHRFAH